MLYLHTYARHVGRLFAGVLFFSPHVMHLIGQWLTYTIPGTRESLRRRGGRAGSRTNGQPGSSTNKL